MQTILATCSEKAVDLSRCKVIIGGGALPPVRAKQMLEMSVDVLAGYDLSETGPTLRVAQQTPHMRDWDLDQQAEVRCRTVERFSSGRELLSAPAIATQIGIAPLTLRRFLRSPVEVSHPVADKIAEFR